MSVSKDGREGKVVEMERYMLTALYRTGTSHMTAECTD